MVSLIESAGGKVLAKKNNSLKNEILILVDDPVEKKHHDGFNVFRTELIFTSIMKQDLDIFSYLIK